MPFSTLIGNDDQPCELVGYGAIPADLAREIAADATLKRLVYDELSGTLLDCGRTTYRPPAGLADFVRARDVHCPGPICRRRALDGHLDHIEPYPKGPTNEKNLQGCCGHEHLMKHAPGWAVRALPDGRIQWITPTGHRYHSHPYDYRPDQPDDELPPDKAPKQRDLRKDLARRLERIERDRRSADLWNGETTPPGAASSTGSPPSGSLAPAAPISLRGSRWPSARSRSRRSSCGSSLCSGATAHCSTCARSPTARSWWQ
jgi:hypothetical protein